MVVLAIDDDQFHGRMAKRLCRFHAAEACSENNNAQFSFARLVHRILPALPRARHSAPSSGP
jgi:hypothetical protein